MKLPENGNVLKALNTDKDYNEKKTIKVEKKKFCLDKIGMFVGSFGFVTGITLTAIFIGAAFEKTIAAAQIIFSRATLITNDFINKLKASPTKVKNFIVKIVLLKLKTRKTSHT